MITVHSVLNPFEPACRDTRQVDARPGLRARDVAPEWALSADSVSVFVSGVRMDMEAEVLDRDVVAIVAVPRAPASIVTYVALFTASLILGRLLAPPAPAKPKDDNESPTYGFDGIVSNRAEGLPIGVVYGRVRFGGQVVAEFVESRGLLGSFYNALISIGEGPIYRLMGRTTDTDPDRPMRSGDSTLTVPRGVLWIDGRDAADFDDLEVHVRLGSLEQEPIRGFELLTETNTVDVPIQGPPASSDSDPEFLFGLNNQDPTTAAGGGSSDVLWDEYGQSYDMTGNADEFTIVVRFPTGLYSIATSGDVFEWVTSLAVRYIELDGTGTPIATGGLESDGYVRLRPTPPLVRTAQGDVQIDFRFPFYDPQTYQRPTLSRVLSINPAGSAENAYASKSSFDGSPFADDSSYVGDPFSDGFSLETWVCLRPDNPTIIGSAVDITDFFRQVVLDWTNESGSGDGGFQLYFERKTFTVAPGSTRQRIVPVLRIVDASGTVSEFWERKGEIGLPTFVLALEETGAQPLTNWYHVAASFLPNADGSLARVRIWGDGELIYEEFGAWDCRIPALATTLYVGREAVSTTDNLKGHLDELVLWRGELTADDVRRAYNGGQGRTVTDLFEVYPGTNSIRISCAGLWHFDTFTAPGDGRGNGEVIADSSGFGNDLTSTASSLTGLFFGETHGYQGFIDQATVANTPKRGRYRVEVMRALADVTTTRRSDDMEWRAIQLHTDELFAYPATPMLGIRVRADDQVNTSAPNVTELVEGRLVPVWDEFSVTSPVFEREWNRNPSWCALDLALSPEYGLGKVFGVEDVDVVAFRDLADYCDEPVYDHKSSRVEYDATTGWEEMRYGSGLLGATAGVSITFNKGRVPDSWKVGHYVGWYGLPAITAGGGPFQDSNVDATGGGGYEIVSIVTTGATQDVVYVRWTASLPPWNNNTDLSTQVTGSLTGTVEGREPRFQLDLAVDTQGSAWDRLVSILATARATPIRLGSRLTVRYEHPRAAVDIIGQGNMDRGSFKAVYAGRSTRPNALDVEFLDADLNFERSTLAVEHPSIQASTSLSDVRRESVFLEGVVRRSQALRHGRYMLNLNHGVKRSATWTSSLDALPLQPGDVVQVAHDVLPRGVSGRVFTADSDTSVKLDRTFTLAAATTYKLAIRDADGIDGNFETRTVSSAAGTYSGFDGDAITVSSAFSFTPARDDTCILFRDGDELPMIVTSISLGDDLRREVSAIEYVEDSFAVEGQEDLEDVPVGDGLAELTAGNSTPPDDVERVRVREITVRGAGGAHRSALSVSWSVGDDSSRVTSSFAIFAARGARSAFQLVSTVSRDARSAVVPIRVAEPGEVWRIAVQPISHSGARRSPALVSHAAVVAIGAAPTPEPPTDIIPSMDGDNAVYSWVRPDDEQASAFELRRGGWILGQHVNSVTHGAQRIGPTSDWTSIVANNAEGENFARYYMRSRSEAGRFSSALYSEWAPRIIGSQTITDATDTFYSQRWELYGTGLPGWNKSGMHAVNSTLTDMVVTSSADCPRGWLEFTGSALTATFQTASPLIPVGTRGEWVYVSAFVEAFQVHPFAFENIADVPWGTIDDQLTWEGPLALVGDGEDDGQCTLQIWVRYMNDDGDWEDWRIYSPCKARCLAAQFELRLTRPSTDFNVRVKRFHTQLLSIPEQRHERNGLHFFAEGRALRNG